MLNTSVKEMEEACYEIITAQRLRSSRNACGREEVFDKVRAVSAYPAPSQRKQNQNAELEKEVVFMGPER